MACTSTNKIVLGCKIPHELYALKWKATGRRRRHKKHFLSLKNGGGGCTWKGMNEHETYCTTYSL
jgi:hypothetical protein